MRVLVVTAMYPSHDKPANGTFVRDQVVSLRKLGVEIDVFSFDGKGSAKEYLKAGLAIRQIVTKNPFDLIHAHYGLSGAASLMQTKCPVVITYHGSDLLGEVGRDAKYTAAGKIKTIISRGSALGAKKRIVVADLLKSKLKPLSTVTIPMGVDLDLFKPIPRDEAREHLGFPKHNRIILFVANPNDPTKRFDIAQKAINLLSEYFPNVDLFPLHNVPHEHVPLYMNASDVLVLTSMHEASPCVIKEAMACNLPIVSVDVGDVFERISGIPGCYICERSPDDIAFKVKKVFNNNDIQPDIRSRISEFSLENIARRVVDVYEEVVH